MYKNKRRTQPKKCEKPKRTVKNRAKGKEAPFAKPSKFGALRRATKENPGINRAKITSERVTVPLEFFNQGVKSKTVRRNAKGCTFKEQNCRFLNEDLHALLQTVSVSSSEVAQSPCYAAKESPSAQTHFDSVTDYYVKLESQQVLAQTSRDANGAGNSLFKEINCLFRETEASDCDSDAPHLQNNQSNGCFCQKLKEQLSSVTLTSRRARCIKRITTLVAEIDTGLEGQEAAFPSEATVKNATGSKTEEKAPAAVPQLIPKSSWQYKTPNSQKLRRPIVPSCSAPLKPCILQAGVRSKVVFELGADITNLDFLDKTFNTLAASICDVDNDSPSFIENLPPANMQPSRSVMSLFSNNAVPLFEDVKEPPPRKNRNLLAPRRPSKAARNVNRGTLGTPRCLFGKTAKRQRVLPENRRGGKENAAIVASQTRLQRDCGGSNGRPQDFSNHPKSAEFPLNETFVMDENFLLPTIPNLSDPMPLSFYPRNTFGAE